MVAYFSINQAVKLFFLFILNLLRWLLGLCKPKRLIINQVLRQPTPFQANNYLENSIGPLISDRSH